MESKTISQLAAQTGVTAKSMNCPSDLEAKVGTTERCIATLSDGETAGVTITVATVNGQDMHLNIQVDSKLTPAATPTTTS